MDNEVLLPSVIAIIKHHHHAYEDRTITVSDHISIFEKKWNTLRQSVASTTAGPDTLASAIKHFAHSDGWKATLLLGTLPKIPLYHSIIDNITAGTDAPAYAAIVLRLKELSDRTIQRKAKKDDHEPPTAFAMEGQRPQRFCAACPQLLVEWFCLERLVPRLSALFFFLTNH